MLSTSDVSKLLGVSERRVRQLARERGVGRQVSGVWLFSLDDLERMDLRPPGRPPSGGQAIQGPG